MPVCCRIRVTHMPWQGPYDEFKSLRIYSSGLHRAVLNLRHNAPGAAWHNGMSGYTPICGGSQHEPLAYPHTDVPPD